jgi:hypothetical protein
MIACDKSRTPDLGVLEVDYRAIVAEEVHLFDPRNIVDTQSLQSALFQVRAGQARCSFQRVRARRGLPCAAQPGGACHRPRPSCGPPSSSCAQTPFLLSAPAHGRRQRQHMLPARALSLSRRARGLAVRPGPTRVTHRRLQLGKLLLVNRHPGLHTQPPRGKRAHTHTEHPHTAPSTVTLPRKISTALITCARAATPYTGPKDALVGGPAQMRTACAHGSIPSRLRLLPFLSRLFLAQCFSREKPLLRGGVY